MVNMPTLARLIHEHFYCNRQCLGERHGARGEDFRSETQRLPLAPSLAPLAWPVGALSSLDWARDPEQAEGRRTVMNNVG